MDGRQVVTGVRNLPQVRHYLTGVYWPSNFLGFLEDMGPVTLVLLVFWPLESGMWLSLMVRQSPSSCKTRLMGLAQEHRTGLLNLFLMYIIPN